MISVYLLLDYIPSTCLSVWASAIKPPVSSLCSTVEAGNGNHENPVGAAIGVWADGC